MIKLKSLILESIKLNNKEQISKNKMDKEQELQEIAELLMQSENLAASVEILRQFADKCRQEGASTK